MHQQLYILLILVLITLPIMSPNVSSEYEKLEVTYVINLKHRPKRLEVFMRHRWPFGKPVRIDAVEGASEHHTVSESARYQLERQRQKGTRMDHREATVGAVGCYASHVKAWRQCLATSRQAFVIFEDDAYPDASMSRIRAFVRSMPKGTDILLLGALLRNFVPHDSNYARVYTFMQTHAYVITREAILKLMPFMLPMTQQIDWELSDHAASGTVRIYAPYIALVKQGKYGTDIQLPLEKKHNCVIC